MLIGDILRTAGIAALTSVDLMPGIIESSGTKPVLLGVYSEHCGYSRDMAVPFADAAEREGANVAAWSVDVDGSGNGDFAGRYAVSGLPTFIGFACEKEAGRVVGADAEGVKALVLKLKDAKC